MLDDILDHTEGYSLDFEQRKVVFDDSDALLVVAGAGSGKTLTILAKIRYLLEIKKIPPDEILCISFTRDTVCQLRDKLKEYFDYEIPVYTFHKLSLEILGDDFFQIAPSNYLSYVVDEYLRGLIFGYPKIISYLLFYFHKNPFSREEYLKLLDSLEFHNFCLDIVQIIGRMRAEGISSESLLFQKSFFPRKRFLLRFLYLLFQEYELELRSQGMIDFDDMILLATRKVRTSGIRRLQYILVDEYQDTSHTRFSLIQAVKEKSGAKLMVVGDDFQSIYRFSGCKAELFVHFSDYFPDATILKLQNTYRNSQQLIDIAGSFILKNKNQIRKVLWSEKQTLNPIRIIWYEDEKKEFVRLLSKLYQIGKRKIMILGRNNRDISFVLPHSFSYGRDGKILWSNHLDMELYYKTVHRSKGLEEEDVILIHLENGENGFPNRRKETGIVKKLFPNYDLYPYAEERRLFYVALTRTKNRIYILSSKKNPSLFTLELQRILKQKNEK